MANTFTPNLENFFDNNVPGGYVETTSNVGGDDLTARINAVLDTKGYLTSNSNVSWLKITGKPNFFSGNYQDLSGKPNLSTVGSTGQWADILNRPSFHAVAITGNYEDLNHLPTIPTVPEIHVTNLQSTGNLIATIQIGDDPNQTYNIKVPEVENTSSGNTEITEEIDPIFTDWLNNSPLTNITELDIENWDNKSNFSGNYYDLNELPELFDGKYSSLTNGPEIPNEGYYDENHYKPFHPITFTGDYNSLVNLPNFVIDFTQGETSALQNFGLEDQYFNNFEDVVFDEETLLSYLINSLVQAYEQQINCYIKNNLGNFKINIMQIIRNNNEAIQYAIFSFDYIINNYSTIRNNNETDSEKLQHLNVMKKTAVITVDNEKNVLYCKVITI